MSIDPLHNCMEEIREHARKPFCASLFREPNADILLDSGMPIFFAENNKIAIRVNKNIRTAQPCILDGGSGLATYEATKAVQRMQNHIEEHNGETITLEDLSKAAGYSQSHSLRIFKELTGSTPFEYIRRCRLTHGARRLMSSDL